MAVPFTALTLFVIYADQLRTAEVWMEVGGEEASSPGNEGAPGEKPSTPILEEGGPYFGEPIPLTSRTASFPPELDDTRPAWVVHKRFGGHKHPHWRREKLGWLGALKSIFRVYQVKGLQNAPPGPRVRRKTKTI